MSAIQQAGSGAGRTDDGFYVEVGVWRFGPYETAEAAAADRERINARIEELHRGSAPPVPAAVTDAR